MTIATIGDWFYPLTVVIFAAAYLVYMSWSGRQGKPVSLQSATEMLGLLIGSRFSLLLIMPVFIAVLWVIGRFAPLPQVPRWSVDVAMTVVTWVIFALMLRVMARRG